MIHSLNFAPPKAPLVTNAYHPHNKTMNEKLSLAPLDTFPRRHIGPLGGGPSDLADMLKTIGVASLDDLIDQTIPAAIRLKKPLNLPEPLGESAALEELRGIAKKNK